MRNYEFIFLADGAAHEDAQLAASILAHSLQQQGLQSRLEGAKVSVQAPAHRKEEPETILIVLDESQLADPALLSRIDDQCAIVVCSARPARTLKHELGRFTAGVATVDALGIASDEGSDPVVAMLGAAARMVQFIDADLLGTLVWNTYDRALPYAARAAVRTFDMGYMQAQQALGY